MNIYIYKLNQTGQEALSAAIKAVAYHPFTIRPSAWFDDAEYSACGFDTGGRPHIELAGRYTDSNHPALIELKREWFDVQEVD